MTAASEPIVAIRDVHQSFGDVEVLKGISLEVPKGGVVCIIGPSGSGKSTLLRCINGLVPINSGSIRVAGFEVQKLKTDQEKIALRKEVSIVFQQYNLFPHKTALQNVMMAPMHVLKENEAEVRERAVALLKKVRLTEKANSYPGELSGGQQQRVAIARSLAMRPEVMLFDEVTAALDPETVKEVLNYDPGTRAGRNDLHAGNARDALCTGDCRRGVFHRRRCNCRIRAAKPAVRSCEEGSNARISVADSLAA